MRFCFLCVVVLSSLWSTYVIITRSPWLPVPPPTLTFTCAVFLSSISKRPWGVMKPTEAVWTAPPSTNLHQTRGKSSGFTKNMNEVHLPLIPAPWKWFNLQFYKLTYFWCNKQFKNRKSLIQLKPADTCRFFSPSSIKCAQNILWYCFNLHYVEVSV